MKYNKSVFDGRLEYRNPIYWEISIDGKSSDGNPFNELQSKAYKLKQMEIRYTMNLGYEYMEAYPKAINAALMTVREHDIYEDQFRIISIGKINSGRGFVIIEAYVAEYMGRKDE